MTLKKFVKAFLAGIAFPAVFLPIAYTILFFLEPHSMRMHPLQFIPMYIPIVFGITNALYIRMSTGSPAQNTNIGLWVTGAALGFIISVIGVFILHVPTLIFGVMPHIEYLPIIVLPIIYGAIFRFIIKWLNKTIAV